MTTVSSGSSPDPFKLGVNVSQKIEQFERLAGKTSNGRTIQPSSQGQKTVSIAQEAMPNVNLQEMTKADAVSPTSWTKAANPLKPQISKAAVHRTNELGRQSLIETPKQHPQSFTPPIKATPQEIDQLRTRLATLKTGINTLNKEPSKKLAFEGGLFGTTTRRFGITLGRSSSTKAVLESLKQMESVALKSNDAELLSQYVGLLKDLKQTEWVKTIEGRNKSFKARLENLSSSVTRGFKERVAFEAQLDVFNATNTDDRKLLQDTIVSLEKRRNLPNLPKEQEVVFDAAIANAKMSLQRIDEKTMVDHLLNSDSYSQGRDLLIDAAGTHIEGNELVRPLFTALAQAKELPTEQQTPAIRSLLQAATKFAALPDEQLDKKFIAQDTKDSHLEGKTLRNALEKLRDETKDSDEPEIRAYGNALAVLLADKPTVSLDPFREAMADNDFPTAFSLLGPLTFLNHGDLQKPLDPSNPNSPTVNQAIEEVLNKFRDEPAYNLTVRTLDILREANAEKVDASPLEFSDKGAIKMETALSTIRGGFEGAVRKAFISDLTQDMRAQFGSLIKMMGMNELRGKAFDDKTQKGEKAPKLTEAIQLYNDLASTVTTNILNPQSASAIPSNKTQAQQRVETINTIVFYADLLESCIEDRNYTAAGAIVSGLSDSSVLRILNAPNINIPERTKAILAKGDALINPGGSYKNYRDAIAAAKKEDGPPPVPLIAVLTNDLVFAEDGNNNKMQNRFNLNKDALIAQITQEFKGFRDELSLISQRNTNFFSDIPIAENFEAPKDGSHTLANINYQRSLELFPRQQTVEKKSFLSKFFQRKV